MGGEGIGTIFGGETFVTGWGQYPITCHVRVALNLISVEVLMLKAFCLIVGSNAWGNSLENFPLLFLMLLVVDILQQISVCLVGYLLA